MVGLASCIPVKFRCAFSFQVHSPSPIMCACVPSGMWFWNGKAMCLPTCKKTQVVCDSSSLCNPNHCCFCDANVCGCGWKKEQEKNWILSYHCPKGNSSLLADFQWFITSFKSILFLANIISPQLWQRLADQRWLKWQSICGWKLTEMVVLFCHLPFWFSLKPRIFFLIWNGRAHPKFLWIMR